MPRQNGLLPEIGNNRCKPRLLHSDASCISRCSIPPSPFRAMNVQKQPLLSFRLFQAMLPSACDEVVFFSFFFFFFLFFLRSSSVRVCLSRPAYARCSSPSFPLRGTIFFHSCFRFSTAELKLYSFLSVLLLYDRGPNRTRALPLTACCPAYVAAKQKQTRKGTKKQETSPDACDTQHDTDVRHGRGEGEQDFRRGGSFCFSFTG